MSDKLYTLDDKQINTTYLRDLALRARAGGPFYLLGFLGAALSSAIAKAFVGIIILFSAAFVLLIIYRVICVAKILSDDGSHNSLYLRHLTAIYTISAVMWFLASFWIYFINPTIDIVIAVNVMATAGITTGGVAAIAPNYTLLRNYCLLMCLPLSLAAGLLLTGPGQWIVASFIAAYGVFMFMVGRQQHTAYWQALNDNLALSSQAKELEKAKFEAEQAGQAKADFLAAMTHEIRTPMNGVLGMAQLLAMGDLSKEHKEQVAAINNAGTTLLHIIDNILDFSKISADKLTLGKYTFSPSAVVDDVILLFSTQAQERGVSLSCDIAEGVPGFAEGDSYRLHQILYNLVGNALKFTENGEVSIELSFESSFSESDDVNTMMFCFTVRDNGIGIKPEDQLRIFEQFHQVNQFSPSMRGTGLGLAITKKLVEMMGGTISLQSTFGLGSVFTVVLPFNTAVGDPLDDNEAELVVQQKKYQVPINVLLAEDNKTNQIICSKFLSTLGCTVDVAETGKQVLQKFQENHYDIILMDCNMPEMDGFSATMGVRKLEQQQQLQAIPIVALTAHVQDDIKEQCENAGMNSFLSKPFLFEELESMIDKIITERSC